MIEGLNAGVDYSTAKAEMIGMCKALAMEADEYNTVLTVYLREKSTVTVGRTLGTSNR